MVGDDGIVTGLRFVAGEYDNGLAAAEHGKDGLSPIREPRTAAEPCRRWSPNSTTSRNSLSICTAEKPTTVACRGLRLERVASLLEGALDWEVDPRGRGGGVGFSSAP